MIDSSRATDARPIATEAGPETNGSGRAASDDPSATRTISRAVARRYLAIHHLLAPPRAVGGGPAGVLAVFDRLGSIQFDPIEIAGRNHDLVLLARVAGYERAMTDRLLYEERALYETYNKGLSLVPTAELPWYRVAWDRSRLRHEADAFVTHANLVDELLTRIRDTGPMSSTDIEPRAAIEWSWRPTNQVRAILEGLAESGILGLAGREGNRRVYDLVERLFPADLLARAIPTRERFRHKLLSRFRANGLLGDRGNMEIWLGAAPRLAVGDEDGLALKTPGRRQLQAGLVADGAIIPVTVEGIRGPRYLPFEALPRLDQAEREVAGGASPGGAPPGVAFVGALDPLVWDRELLASLYDFDYLWEVYVPAVKRRWGYYVLPILFGDRFVGRIEPRIERRTDTLRIVDVWWEHGFDPLAEAGFVAAFAAALEAHRRFGAVRRLAWPRVARHRSLGRAVKELLGQV